MNSFAITSAGIGEALQRSASALFEAGNTIDESVALVTAANSVIQNPEQVGTALKTLALRLRGAKTELEEASLDTDNMAESTATLQAKLKALTHGKVDIMLDADTFKSTTQILREMAEAWEDMSDIERASALELMGGKRQANILASVIKNFDTVESVIETSLNSQGSAMAENEKYLDSIQGKTDILTNSMQTLWNNALNSDFMKFLLDIANGFVQVVDSAGLLNSAVSTFLGYKALTAKDNTFFDFLKIFKFDDDGFGLNNNSAIGQIISGAATGGISGAASAFKTLGVGAKAAAIGTQMLNSALTMGVSLLAGFVINKVIEGIDNYIHRAEILKEEVNEIIDTYKNSKDTLLSNKKTIDNISGEYEKLSSGVDKFGNNINLTTTEYARYNEIVNQIASMFPTMVSGYTAEGNAILSTKGNVEALTEAYQEQAEAARNAVILDGDKVFADAKNDIESAKEQLDAYDVAIEMARGLASKRAIEKYGDHLVYDAEKILKEYGFEENYNKYASGNIEETYGLAQKWSRKDQSYVNDYTYDEEIAHAEKINKLIIGKNDLLLKQQGALSKVNTVLQAYLDNNSTYAGMEEKMQSTISSIVSSLNPADFNYDDDAMEAFILTNVIAPIHENRDYVQEALSDLLTIDEKTTSYNMYAGLKSALLASISSLPKQTQEAIKKSFGLGDDSAYEIYFNHAKKILQDEYDNMVNELTLSDLQIIDKIKVPDGTLLTWDGLLTKIKETKNTLTGDFDISKYSESISSIVDNISTYQSALEKLESGTFTMSDFVALIEKFPELAKGVDVSSKNFNGLYKNLRRAVKSSPDELITDLKELKSQLIDAGKSTTEVDALIASLEDMPTDALDSVISKYSTLVGTINAAKIAQNELAESMNENPNAGYETRAQAMEYMKEAMKKGEIGSESNLWNVAEKYGFTYNSAQSINDNADALANFIATREQWFATDDDGNYTFDGIKEFIKDVENVVNASKEAGTRLSEILQWNYDDETGALQIDFDNANLPEIISLLSQTEELIRINENEWSDLMTQIGQYFGIKWGDNKDAKDHLDGIAKSAKNAKDNTEEYKKQVEEYGKTMQDYFGRGDVDLTNRPMVTGKEMRDKGWDVGDGEYATVHSTTYYKSDFQEVKEGEEDTAVVLTPILPDGTVLSPDALESYAAQILNGESIDVNNITLGIFDDKSQLDNFESILSEIQYKYDQLRDPLNLSTTIDNEGIEGLEKIPALQDTIAENSDGVTIVDKDAFRETLEAEGYAEDYINTLIAKVQELSSEASNIEIPATKSEDPLGLNDADLTIDKLKSSLGELDVAFTDTLGKWFDGKRDITIDVNDLVSTLKAKNWTDEAIKSYCDQLSNSVDIEGFNIKVDGIENIDEVIAKSNEVPETESTQYEVTGEGLDTVSSLPGKWSEVPKAYSTDYTITQTTVKKTVDDDGGGFNLFKPSTWFDGPVVDGTAHATGSWGAPKTETALVGELGPELLVRGNRWTTVGDNGAEFTEVKKGDIIFNHKQTEDLLSKGYVTGRGKLHGGAFASGTAYFDANSTFGRYDFDDEGGWTEYDINDEVVDSLDGAADAAKKISSAIDEAADSVEKFEETIDFIEIRMEEFDERIGKLSAELENLATYAEKNRKIDSIIAENQKKYADALAGAKYYENYAQKYLAGMNDDLVAAAKNGAIAITEFTKEQDEATINAIQNYRDYAQKAADLYQQAEEIITEIRDSVIQKIDNIQSYGDAKVSIEDLQTEKLQNRVDYWETKGEIPASAYYGVNGGDAKTSTGMFENSYKKIEYWTPLLEDMQKEFNDAVKSGKIEVGTIEWYEQLEKLYTVQSEIDAATIEIEEFQNAINDLYWDNFDQLINRLDYLKDETQNLIDLMDSEDMVVDPVKRKYENGTVEYWTADDVKWSEEGLATLGLYAQQMEIAEYKAKQYAVAIEDLTKEYEAGHYSESEYLEKLNELKNAQYESIEDYYAAQDAIKELNKTRIDSIKKGIEKEIEAYEELINAKKELLNSEKDAHDFQKTVLEQQKNISDIERKLAALAYDNSASARAKRAQLEAELAKAQNELDETYYDRSIEEQQNALDKELENFQKEKDAEVTKMEEYLEDIKQVVADSLITVQANASGIYDTLSGKAQEYNLTLSDSILTPWKDGSLAVSSYQETFDTAMSSTMDQLDALKNKWQEVIDKMAEAGNADVANINKENANYASATYTPPKQPSANTNTTQKTEEVNVGDTINAKGAPIYADTTSNEEREQYFSEDPYYTVVSKKGDYVLARHKSQNTGYSGWFKEKDVTTHVSRKYAKGTTSVNKDGLALIDELGEELRLIPDGNGRLAYMKKGTGVVPADLTANLMEWGKLDPTNMLDQNRPEIGVSPSVVNNTTEIHIDASVGELLHVEHLDGNNPAEISKIVDKAWDKRMKELNGYVRRYVR